jgi:TusA-related sulfurtransferase
MDTPGDIIEYDIRGQICPSTLLIALREIKRNADRLRRNGTSLIFITDNRDATQTLPETAANLGFGAEVSQRGGSYAIRIFHRDDSNAA